FNIYSYNEHWLPQRDFMVNTYFHERTQVLLNQLRSAGLFPGTVAPEFLINNQPFPVETIDKGDVLSMTSSEGVIYYTTNGQDPAKWEQQDGRSETTLIGFDAIKYVIVPKKDIGDRWRTDGGYDHSSWTECDGKPGGIGYDTKSGYEKFISLDVSSEMHHEGNNPNTSCYVRIPFAVDKEDFENLHTLYLNVLFDDGFVVFLNGTRIFESNVPSVLEWNSVTTDSNETTDAEQFNISEFAHLLVEGENLLAVHAMNTDIYSSDFLFNVELIASDQINSSVTSGAQMYSEPIKLTESTCIKARTYLNGSWSALMSSSFIFQDDYENLKITEIHYNPSVEVGINSKDLEFIELKNTGSSTLDISAIRFSDGIEFTFPSEIIIPADSFFVLASDWEQFYERYGFLPDGEYNGNLNNDGEQLLLESSIGYTISFLFYGNDSPWPTQTDGEGYSLVPVDINPVGNQNEYSYWRISYHLGGSPGKDDKASFNNVVQHSEKNEFKLSQNYPNPFSGITYINYELPEKAWVNISVYNLLGQKVTVLYSGYQKEGSHLVSWHGSGSHDSQWMDGVFIYRMIIKCDTKQQIFTRKMIQR
ncbi:MAG: lamin tail domain-containing protein, partial [Bacteroidales bacterium]|nr:lamin tail domain-containing protein [Bacteroidales bacterium]